MVSPLSDGLVSQIPFPVEAGSPHPLGATPSASGVNFSIASSNAAGVKLLLFSAHDSLEPFQTIRFDPYLNKTFHQFFGGSLNERGLKDVSWHGTRLNIPGWDTSVEAWLSVNQKATT